MIQLRYLRNKDGTRVLQYRTLAVAKADPRSHHTQYGYMEWSKWVTVPEFTEEDKTIN